MSEANTPNIDAANSETNYVYLTDNQNTYLLDKLGVYLTTTNEKESDIMATKKYVSLEKLGLYDEKIKGVISAGDADALQSAKDYADSLATNYDGAGAATTAESNAKKYTDEQITAVNTTVAGVKTTAEKGVADAATADGKAVAAQQTADEAKQAVADLEDYVGDIPSDEAYADVSTVIGYVNKKAEETLAAAQGGSSETAASVKAQLDTYKTENDAKVNKNTEDIATAQTAADGAQTYAEGVAADLAEAVETLESADSVLDGRIQTLEGQITGLSGAMHFKGVITGDALPETTDGYANGDVVIFGNKEYVVNNGAFVEFGDVDAQAEAITELTGKVSTLETDMGTAKTDIDNVEVAVAKKVEQTAFDEAVESLQGEDTAIKGRLDIIEGQLGDAGDVAQDIATAKSEAITEAVAQATTKDAQVLADAKTYTNTEVGKDRTRLDALEADTHTHSNKTLLDTYTQTEENLADAVAKKHEHSNLSVLEGITSAKVTAWDAAEGNAKTFAQGLNDAMATRMDAVEAWQTNMIEVSEEEINALFA